MEIDWYKHPQFIPDKKLNISAIEATSALKFAWKNIYGTDPSDNSLAILFAQCCLETGWFNVGFHNYNYGNIKADINYKALGGDHFFTMYECGETENGKNVTYYPPHIQTHFRAYKTLIKGAEDYIRFLSQRSRYKAAWAWLLKGDPKQYSYALKSGGYYTADREIYTGTVVRLFNEFHKRKEELLSWKPEEAKLEPVIEEKKPEVVIEEPRTDRVTTIPPASPESIKPVVIPPTTPLPKINQNKFEKEEIPNFKKGNSKNFIVVAVVLFVGYIASALKGCEGIF